MGSITPQEFEYQKDSEGVYKLMCGGTVLSASLRVAVACAVTREESGKVTVTRHRFGPPFLVHQWFAITDRKYRDMGLGAIADELCIIESDRWDVEDLNRIIHVDGWLGVFFSRIGLRYVDLFPNQKSSELTPG